VSVLGYDGIVYGSEVGAGKSIAVFDLVAAKIANRQLFKVDAFTLEFSKEPIRIRTGSGRLLTRRPRVRRAYAECAIAIVERPPFAEGICISRFSLL
jgi:hypothetical protein